jgi:hypothetical protein
MHSAEGRASGKRHGRSLGEIFNSLPYALSSLPFVEEHHESKEAKSAERVVSC